MGHPLWRPEKLAEKLLHIRLTFGLSQSQLVEALGVAEEIPYNRISDYERNKTAPPLPVLTEYARIARVHLEEIVDDRLDLPKSLPGTVKYEAWSRPRPKRSKTSGTRPKRKKKR